MEGDDNFLSLPHTCTHYLPSWGKKEVTESPRPSIPPSRLPTSDLSRQPPLVPEHDELWDSGGVTPSSGPPTHPLPLNPLLILPPAGFCTGFKIQ